MNLIVTLCLICIFIEIYHVCYHDYIYNQIFNPMSKRHEMIKAYQDLWRSHVKFVKGYRDNKKKEEISLEDIEAIQKLTQFTEHFGTKSSFFKKEFVDYFGSLMVGKFVLQQFIEIAYAIIIIIIALNLPIGIGLLFYIFMILISYFAQQNEKANAEDKIKYLYIADTIICITVYFVIIFAYC